MPRTEARVSCGAVTLKLTLTEKLLGKSVRDALVAPFLRAHAKKTGVTITCEDVGTVLVDGSELVAWTTVTASAALPISCEVEILSKVPLELEPLTVSGIKQATSATSLSSILGTLGSGGKGGGELAALRTRMEGVKHLLPAEMQAQADSILQQPGAFEAKLEEMRTPTEAEVAYGGTAAAGEAQQAADAIADGGRDVGPVRQAVDTVTQRAAEALQKSVQRVAALELEADLATAAASAAVAEVVPGARVERLTTLGGRLVVVIDDVFEQADLEQLRNSLEHRARFARREVSRRDRPEQQHFVTEHDLAAFLTTPVYRRIAQVLPLFFAGRPLTPNRIYTNAMLFGDVAHAHRDAAKCEQQHEENVTALVYSNGEWDSSCAGETIFFSDDREDARLAVLPRPGRLLLFAAPLLHVGRAPSRLFWGQRFTTAIKFVAGKTPSS